MAEQKVACWASVMAVLWALYLVVHLAAGKAEHLVASLVVMMADL